VQRHCRNVQRHKKHRMELYLGIFSGRARPEKSPTQKCRHRPGPARPDCRAKNLSPGPARGGYFLLGRRAVGPDLPKIFHFSCPGPAQLDYRTDICCLGPARLHVLARRAGPFFGPSRRAGLPMPRYRWNNPQIFLLLRATVLMSMDPDHILAYMQKQ
jgi:hypothetical protein